MESEVTCDKPPPPPAGLETGFLFLFLGAEWRHIKVSRSTTLTQQKREPQRECVFEKSLSVRLWLHIPTFSPQRNTFFVFFFCLLIFAIFSHDFITNWKKKKKKETEMQVVKVLRDVLRHQLTSVL